jgi:hypothetical protein
MVRSIPLLGLVLSLVASRPGLASEVPSFECTDGESSSYRIWLQPQHKVLEVTEKGKKREIPLSEPNVGRRPQGPGEPLIYNRFNRAGVSLADRVDLSTEVTTQYLVQGGKSQVDLSIVVDHRERIGLTCKSLRQVVSVVPTEKKSAAIDRYARQIRDAASLRTKFGTLWRVGSLAVEAAVLRMLHSPDFAQKASRDAFVEGIASTLKNIDPRTIKLIGEELPKEASTFWSGILKDIKYAYYPELMRYASWISEGARPGPERDWESLQAGFGGFLQSSVYADKGMRDFFAVQIDASLKRLGEAEIAKISDDLDAEGKAFLNQIWTKAVGRRTVAELPDVDQYTKRLAAAIEAKEFNPSEVATVIASSQRMTSTDPEALRLFMQGASPLVKKLTPRQREDVMGWLKPSEKPFLTDLLR